MKLVDLSHPWNQHTPGWAWGDIASLPLTKLVHEGIIVDVSDAVGDWDVIRPEHITRKVSVKRGDVLILHTGYLYYAGMPEQDLTRYFCMHPGGAQEPAAWMLEMEISWWGVDECSPWGTTGSAWRRGPLWTSRPLLGCLYSYSPKNCPTGIFTRPSNLLVGSERM